jgi:hypothetical protein
VVFSGELNVSILEISSMDDKYKGHWFETSQGLRDQMRRNLRCKGTVMFGRAVGLLSRTRRSDSPLLLSKMRLPCR